MSYRRGAPSVFKNPSAPKAKPIPSHGDLFPLPLADKPDF
jgi:hypothetical protein